MVVGEDTLGEQAREFQFEESSIELNDPLVYLAQPDSSCCTNFCGQTFAQKGSKPRYSRLRDAKRTVCGIFQPKEWARYGGQIAAMDVFSMQHVFNRGRNFVESMF
jgi:putative ABC transport system permease protein